MSFTGGVQSFIDHLASVITADWRLDEPLRRLLRDGNAYRLLSDRGEVTVDRVVLCNPAYVAAELLHDLDPELAALLAGVSYSPIAVVGLGYRHAPQPLDGFGLLTTTAARQPILGVLWDSSIFPDRAPAGGATLRVMIGGQRNPELVDQDEAGLLRTAREGVARTMGLEAEPDVTFVQRWPRGIPNYAVGHLAAMRRVFERLETQPGLYLHNNAYRGIAMNDCVRNGRALAEALSREPGG
jgi:oxygen-dependent protoporphyrinogen oxidase